MASLKIAAKYATVLERWQALPASAASVDPDDATADYGLPPRSGKPPTTPGHLRRHRPTSTIDLAATCAAQRLIFAASLASKFSDKWQRLTVYGNPNPLITKTFQSHHFWLRDTMYHWSPRRIEAHVRLCVLALQMQRAAELRCSLPWARIAHILAGLKAVRYQIEGRTIVQRTKMRAERRLSSEQR